MLCFKDSGKLRAEPPWNVGRKAGRRQTELNPGTFYPSIRSIGASARSANTTSDEKMRGNTMA